MKRRFTAAIVGMMMLLGSVRGDEDLARVTWQIPSHAEVEVMLQDWATETDVPETVWIQVQQQWAEPIPSSQRLSLLSRSFELLGGDLGTLMQSTRTSRFARTLPDVSFLEDVPSEFIQHHARLIFARWLVQNQLYNETLEQLTEVPLEKVMDPATLLFCQAIAHHRLLDKEACLPIVNRLLEREDDLPRRFAILAKMIRDDIKPLEADSLDEVSRLMDSIRVRLGLGRVGKRVRTEEDDVIEKLDKLIKDLEDQAKQQSQSQSSGSAQQQGNNLNPSQPMEDSMPAGGRGEGNVDPKDIGTDDGWGDLPAKERQQALQQVGKDFPSHYRDVIEGYFRKLAKDGADSP